MKLEYIGCCYRFELEFFGWTLDLQKYQVAERDELPDLKKRLLRQIKSRLKSEGSVFPNIKGHL